jgi:sialic acid synthase SpsE/sugar phosphate isomerase/epimerase
MIFDRNLTKYLISEDETIRAGLAKIESNENGIIFCVGADSELTGVFSDGDLRRWAMSQAASVDLGRPLSTIMNRNFVAASVGDSTERIASLYSDRVRFIPVLDEWSRCVAIMRPRQDSFTIGSRKIGSGNPVFVIAEIGNNHNGDPDLARRLVDDAKAAGADCVKFQLRDMETLYVNAGNADDAREDLGSQYTLDLLSRFQLKPDTLFNVFDYCHEIGILPLCTPWDPRSAELLNDYGVQAFKVASADLTNHDLLRILARTGKPLLCSTGMSTDIEIGASIRLLNQIGAEFALLHCNSTYPAPFHDLNLAFIATLREMGKCPVGYSSHDRGYSAVLAAVALGANIVEKHFTLDRNMEGNDHRVSLLPSEFAEMVTAIRQVEASIGQGGSRHLSQGERMNRETLGKSLVIKQELQAGAAIEESMIEVRSPGRGLAPYRKVDVIGRVARRNLKPGDVLFEADISEVQVGPRRYAFDRPFGIPVRYHDLKALGSASNFDLLEFHLSYKDMDLDVDEFFHDRLDCELVVHAPELFAGDHVLDLCSRDPQYRKRSISELERVIAGTRQLQAYFPNAKRPRIIVNVGGFTQDAPLAPSQRRERYEMVLESLASIDNDGVEILPQTMPPFPWHFGGQRYQNLFVDPEEIAEICGGNDMRVCLDTSHSKLACTHNKWSFVEFISKVGPHTGHLHIADARGVDGEGLQVGEGDIALGEMGDALNRFAPKVSFIPEIWQGHKNSGEGFWVALERLERYL